MSFILQESYFKKVKQGEMVYKRRWVVPSSGEKNPTGYNNTVEPHGRIFHDRP